MLWRNIVMVVGLVPFVACSAGDAVMQTGEAEPLAESDSSVVQPSDIPADVQPDSWARLPLPQRDELDEDGQRAFDIIVNPESRYSTGLRGPVGMWMYSPQMAEHMFPASSYLRFGTSKDQRLTELVILATAREVRSQYEWTTHEPAALREGLEPEIIELVKRRADLDAVGDTPGLGERERLLIAFVREVITQEKVASETFSQARDLFGDPGVMDLAGLVGYYNYVNLTIKTFDVQLAPGRERLLPDLW